MPQKTPDVNLPDESAGKPIGRLARGDQSKEPFKQRYIDKLESERAARVKGGFYRNRPLSDYANDRQQADQAREIFGGDADDPRWKEHEARMKRQALTSQMKDK